jgi:hypothetical protein
MARSITQAPAVVLAASYPPRDYKSRADSHEIAAAVRALTGAIFQQGWTLVFGGHPAVSPLILMIAREFGQRDRVAIYQSAYFQHHIGPATRALTSENFGKIVFTPNFESEIPPALQAPVDPTKCPKSLEIMRRQMIQHPGVVGLVLIGGDTGLRQELELFAEAHPQFPIVPIGAPGGIARELVGKMHAPGLQPDLQKELAESHNYFTLSSKLVRYLKSPRRPSS